MSIARIAIALATTLPAMTQTPVCLISIDDVGRELLEEGRTPGLDSLRPSGLWFSRYWSSQTCSPDRASVITGRHAFRPESLMFRAPRHGNWSLPTDAALPRQLPGTSVLVGKHHLSTKPHAATHPFGLGYDPEWSWWTTGNLNKESYYSYKYHDALGEWTSDVYATHAVRDSALKAIRDGHPFFLNVSFHAVHQPFEAPPDGDHTYGDLTGADTHTLKLAMLESLDRAVSAVAVVAYRAGYVVIITTDNGTGGTGGGEGKHTLYESGLHTWALVLGGRAGVCDELVQSTDLYPTIAELVRGDVAIQSPDAYSFAGALHDPAWLSARQYCYRDKAPTNGAVPLEADRHRAVKDRRWKYIRLGLIDEFYDLDADPTEQVNLLTGGLTDEQGAALVALRDEVWRVEG